MLTTIRQLMVAWLDEFVVRQRRNHEKQFRTYFTDYSNGWIGSFRSGHEILQRREDENWIEVLPWHWGVTHTEFARVCVANTRTGTKPPTETIAFTFVQIEDELGRKLIRRELAIPVNEFRCTDLTYRQLGDAGLGTEPSGRRQFLIDIVDGSSNTQTTAQPPELTLSIETIDVNTAQTQWCQTFRWRFATHN